MRELAYDHFHYTLYQDDTDGALYLEAICNQSAFYFTMAAKLLPSEIEGLFREGTTDLTAGGRARLGHLADAMQWSPEKFSTARREAWRQLGYSETPAVPPLRPSSPTTP
jgi:hypothetical protein